MKMTYTPFVFLALLTCPHAANVAFAAPAVAPAAPAQSAQERARDAYDAAKKSEREADQRLRKCEAEQFDQTACDALAKRDEAARERLATARTRLEHAEGQAFKADVRSEEGKIKREEIKIKNDIRTDIAKADRAVKTTWDRIEFGVQSAVGDFIGEARNIIHDRPELQAIPHLVLLRKGENVKIAYCRSPLGQLFRDRQEHPSENACDEVLTKGSFNINSLEACAARHDEQGMAAANLQRELTRVISRQESYDYNYLGIWASRDEYRDLFRTCSAEIARAEAPKPARRVAAAPRKAPAGIPSSAPVPPLAPPPGVEPAFVPPLEFHPVDHSGEEAPAAPAAAAQMN